MRQVIYIGDRPRDNTGDTLRACAIKCNQNFEELYHWAGVGPPVMQLVPTTFAGLPMGQLGMVACITDSKTVSGGTIVRGGGSHQVLAFHNGVQWIVVGG